MKKYVDKDKLQEYTTKLIDKIKTIFATKDVATMSTDGLMSASDKAAFNNSTVVGKGSSTETSIDDIIYAGTYWLSSANTPSGWPSEEGTGGKNGVLNVFYNGGSRIQELIMYNGLGKNNKYVRMYINSQWYPWRIIATGPTMSIDYGTEIPSNANLNNYSTPGNYYVDNATIAATITKSPITNAGYTLRVVHNVNTTWNIMQIAITQGGNEIYIRSNYGTAWNSWYKYTGTLVSV